MKKRNLFFSAIAGMMLFTACSSEEGMPNDGLDGGAQEFNLQVANYGDELQSRAGRPLLSDEAKQEIQNVVLFICKSDTREIVYTKSYNDWQNQSATYANGRQTKLVLQGDDKLAAGQYKVYAIGYSNDSDYDLSAITGLVKGSTYTENVLLKYKAGKSVPEEIFAGALNLNVTANKSFTQDVILNRQVSGAYIYAYNIPYFAGMAANGANYKLQLVASDANDVLVLGYLENNKDIPNNGGNTSSDVQYVVNGAKSAADATVNKVICSTTLGEWYTTFAEGTKDGVNNGILDVAGWKATKDAPNRKGGAYAKGSVFAANFVIPFQKIDNTQTLKLELVDETGAVLRYWNVNLPADEQKATQLTAWDGSKFAVVPGYAATSKYYSIVRNHLYSVGHKEKDGVHGDPDPEPTPDGPEDLSKSQTLNLKVNHNWEVIHKMELE